ncbi:MAG: VWA domain-containing protein [Phycisphaerae bacterium]|nr:VWA domain-containing protein [Phycisphaerae bacterium]
MHVEFDNLQWANLLWVALGVFAIGVFGVWQRHRALRIFAAAHLLDRLAPRIGWFRPLLRLTLVLMCLGALVMAIVGPRWGETQQRVVRRNVDVMVLLDVSRSMLARDLAPNRLERAKVAIRDDLLPALGGDRVGLITFAGVASLTCPLTTDYGFFRMALDDVSTLSAPRGGTMIGDAIRKAADAFESPIDTHKLIVLITDGEDHDSYPVQAAQGVWEDYKIPIISIALGDEREGARIPIEGDRGVTYLEHDGQTVWSKANFDDLRAIARISDLNVFVPAGTRTFDLGEIYRRVLSAIEVKSEESEEVAKPSRYYPFAVAALTLLLFDSFLRDGRRFPKAAAIVRLSKREAA